jgi:YMGG-like Gly-zipper
MYSRSLSPWVCVLALAIFSGCHSSQNSGSSASTGDSSTASAVQPAPQQQAPPIVIPAGTTFSVTIDQDVSSKDSQPDQRVAASLADPIIIDGRGVIRRGAKITGKVINAKSAGRFKGSAELGITLASVEVDGKSYPLHTSSFSESSKGRGKRTVEGAAIGAGAGTLIGALAGRGKGAAIGAGAGGGAGVAGAAMTGNRDVTIATETKVDFKLTQPLEIQQK